jgi:prepilin-type N-terminal cleavage/methylation domain-containing protein
MTLTRHSLAAGFTLTELAVVLVIVALLLGGLLVPLSSQQEIRYRQDTEKVLATARESLIGFVAANGRLPCPADPTIASGTSGAGQEATNNLAGASLACTCTTSTSDVSKYYASSPTYCPVGSANTVSGVLPWSTLGLPEGDAWNRRFTYRVTYDFSRGIGQTTFSAGCVPTSNPTQAAFAICSVGGITVNTAQSGGTTLASTVPALILSHGKNGVGAYQSDGSQVGGSSTADEQENSNFGNATFVSNSGIDDQMTWLPLPLLMSRMLAAGKLP